MIALDANVLIYCCDKRLHLQQRWAFWDALLVAACLDSGVTRLYSEDLPGRAKIDSLEIANPFA